MFTRPFGAAAGWTASSVPAVTIWNDFLISSTMMNTTKTPTLIVSINSFFGKYVNEYGFAFAGILLATLPIAVLFIFLQKYFVAGMTAGAVKG